MLQVQMKMFYLLEEQNQNMFNNDKLEFIDQLLFA